MISARVCFGDLISGPLQVYITCKLFPYFLLRYGPTQFIIKQTWVQTPHFCVPESGLDAIDSVRLN